MATSIPYPPKVKTPAIVPPPAYDFSKDALQPSASGLTAQQMGRQAEQQMKDRVIAQSQAAPGTLATGAQMGALQTGTERTPITFQAFTQGGTKPAPTGSGSGMTADQIPFDPNTGRRDSTGWAQTGVDASGNSLWSKAGQTSTAGASGDVGDAANYNAPDTSAPDAQIKGLSMGRSQADIDAELNQSIENITRRYDDMKRATMDKFGNRKAEQFGELAGIGTGINPLSSGAQAVSNVNDNLMDEDTRNIEAQKQNEIARAQAIAAGAKVDANSSQLKYLTDERARMEDKAKTDYEMRRQSVADSVDALNRAAAQAKEDRITTNAERDDARSNIKMLFDSLGSAAFDGVSDADLLAMEKSAGLPAGSITKQARTIKEQEIAAKTAKAAGNHQFVSATKYQKAGVLDKATGTFTPLDKFMASAAATGGGGVRRTGGGGSAPAAGNDDETKAIAKYFDTFGEYPAKANIPWVVAQYQSTMNPAGFVGPVNPSTDPFASGRKAQLEYKTSSAKAADPLAALLGGSSLVAPPAAAPAQSSDLEDLGVTQEGLDAMLSRLR